MIATGRAGSAQAADLLQAYEARIAALDRLVGKQALELEFLKGARRGAPPPRSGPTAVIIGPAASPSPKDDRLTPSHARSGARRRRYYVSRRLIIGPEVRRDPAAWRLPAAELERAAGAAVAHHMRRCLDQHRLVSAPNPQISHHLKAAAGGLLARHDDVASTGWLHLMRVVPGRLFLT